MLESGSSQPDLQVRFQPELTRMLQQLAPGRPHLLLVSGPEGCGQSSTARLAADLRTDPDAPVVRLLPGELDGLSPAEALQRLHARWVQASGGVLLVPRLQLLLALPAAELLLEAMWRWRVEGEDAPTLLLAGDAEATDALQGLAPRLFWAAKRAVALPLSPEQLAALLASLLAGVGLRLELSDLEALALAFRSVLQPGDLVNSRLPRALLPLVLQGCEDGLPVDLAALAAVQRFSVSESSSALEDLEHLIGLEAVKEQVRRLARNASLQHRRQQLGIDVSGMGHHMVFAGPAGTAKTTVARIVGRILRDAGILPSGHMVEVQRADVIAADSATTARRMVEKVQRAFGGVLFIDEAYTLTAAGERSEGEDQGREALETLMKMMEDYRDRFVVIVAGYPQEMDAFLNSNPGLRSRFSHNLLFPSYQVPELMEILHLQAADRGYVLAEDVEQALAPHLQVSQHYPGFGNGRYIRTLLEAAIVRQGERLEPSSSDAELRTLTAEDFERMINSGHRFGLT